jgi:mannose-1-phosphate guanylyltransferase
MMQGLQANKTSHVERWAVILAGGDGTRLRSFTRSLTGDDRPKQFAPVIGGKTLLDQTRARVALSIPEDQTLTIVTKSHEQYYRPLLNNPRLLVQPENKGTAPGIIYPLIRIAAQSPDAVVAMFPSDHYFTDDERFMSYVELGFEAAGRTPNKVMLLGISPEAPEVDFGWIEPDVLRSRHGVAPVRRFWEKPSTNLARTLMERGCLWNSFVMIGCVKAFLSMTKRTLPELFEYFQAIIPTFGTSAEFANLKAIYSWLPELNFSHKVLAMRPDDLGVIKVDKVGWSDLGDPARVRTTLSRIGHEALVSVPRSSSQWAGNQ